MRPPLVSYPGKTSLLRIAFAVVRDRLPIACRLRGPTCSRERASHDPPLCRAGSAPTENALVGSGSLGRFGTRLRWSLPSPSPSTRVSAAPPKQAGLDDRHQACRALRPVTKPALDHTPASRLLGNLSRAHHQTDHHTSRRRMQGQTGCARRGPGGPMLANRQRPAGGMRAKGKGLRPKPSAVQAPCRPWGCPPLQLSPCSRISPAAEWMCGQNPHSPFTHRSTT